MSNYSSKNVDAYKNCKLIYNILKRKTNNNDFILSTNYIGRENLNFF